MLLSTTHESKIECANEVCGIKEIKNKESIKYTENLIKNI